MAINCPFGVNPLDQSQETKVPKLSFLSYTHQDFESMKSRLVKFILERFPRDFTDFVESSLAIMEMEIFAFIADTLSFKIDQIANEIYIDTVTEVENIFRIAKAVGFTPLSPLPATAFCSATITAVQPVDMVIPGGVLTTISINNQRIPYEIYFADSNNNPAFDEDIVIPAGSQTNTSLIAVQGQTFTDTFVGTGNPNQIYQLESFPVLFDSVRVQVDGVRWELVDYFSDSQPRREFRIEFDSQYHCFVIFGNNRTGMIPAEGSNIAVTYRVGGGTIGNIITGYIDFQFQYEVQDLGYSIPVGFRNYTAGVNGYDGDSIDDVRDKLPAYIKTQERCVTGEDYKTTADLFATAHHGQIGKSNAVLRNYGCAGNIVDIYVLARDGTSGLITANNDLKTALQDEFETKKMITDFVCIRDGIVMIVDITIDLTLDKSLRKNREELDLRVRRKIDEFFLLNNWEFGQSLKQTDLVKQLSEIREIESFDSTFVTNDPDNGGDLVTTKFYEIIRPDAVNINYIFV
jgi:hypothetical protein